MPLIGSEGGGEAGSRLTQVPQEVKFKKLKIKQQKVKVMGKIDQHLGAKSATAAASGASMTSSAAGAAESATASSSGGQQSTTTTTSTGEEGSRSLLSSIVWLTTGGKSGDSGSCPEFGSKDLLLASLLWAADQSVRWSQSPLPPFLIPDHFKSSTKYSIKGSSSASSFPAFPFPLQQATLLRVLRSGSQPPSCGQQSLARLLSAAASVPVAVAGANGSSSGGSEMSATATDRQTATSVKCVPVPLSLPSWIKVKEYAPVVFACLRDKVYPFPSKKMFHACLVDVARGPPERMAGSFVERHLAPVAPGANSDCCSSNSVYSSADQQLVVKSIEGSDVEGLLSLLKSLHPYLVQRKSSSSSDRQQQLLHSLLPQYVAVFRISHAHHQPIHQSLLHHHKHHYHQAAKEAGTEGGSGGKRDGKETTTGLVGSLLAQMTVGSVVGGGSSSASGPGKGAPSGGGSESSTYLLLMRNPVSCSESFFPIHDLFVLSADGVVGHRVRRTSTSSLLPVEADFQLTLKKEDADRLTANLESDLRFLSAHLLTGYTLSIGLHSIDEWEREMMLLQQSEEEGEEEEEEDEGESEEEILFTQQQENKKNRRSSNSVVLRGGSEQEAVEEETESTVVIDPMRHPFAVPSPFVGVDSRASSRPSLHSSTDTQDSGLPSAANRLQAGGGYSGACGGGRFVYFVGMNDLLPLSSSFSSKELDLEKKLDKKDRKKRAQKQQQDKRQQMQEEQELDSLPAAEQSTTTATVITGTTSGTGTAGEMGKKESAREYSRNLLSQFRKRIRVVAAVSGNSQQQQVAAAMAGDPQD